MATTRLERGTYIGGHDASAIIGRHPYKRSGDVYAKLVLKHRPDISDNKVIRRGIICEPGLLTWVGQTRQQKLKTDVHVIDTIPYFAGTLDAVEPETGVIHDVTVTTTRSKAWLKGPAEYKVLQLQWYMGLAEAAKHTISKNGLSFEGYPYPLSDEAFLTVLYADTGDIDMIPVYKDDRLIRQLRTESQNFMINNVRKEIVPDDISEGSAKILYPKDNGKTFEERPSKRCVQHAFQYIQARDMSNEWSEAKKNCASIIKSEMKHDTGYKWDGDEDKGSISWKQSKGRTKIQFEEMAKDLCQQLEISFADLCERYTKTSAGARVLRVNVTKKRNGEDNE